MKLFVLDVYKAWKDDVLVMVDKKVVWSGSDRDEAYRVFERRCKKFPDRCFELESISTLKRRDSNP